MSEKKKYEYTLIATRENITSFIKEVNGMVSLGWRPIGSVFSNSEYSYIQTLIRDAYHCLHCDSAIDDKSAEEMIEYGVDLFCSKECEEKYNNSTYIFDDFSEIKEHLL